MNAKKEEIGYTVASGSDRGSFASAVRTLLREGWQLQGGVAVVADQWGGRTMLQAMVLNPHMDDTVTTPNSLFAYAGAVLAKSLATLAPASPAPVVADSEPKGDGWNENAEWLLKRCPHTIRVREGGGPENLLSSLVCTFMKMQDMLSERGK